MVVPLVVFSFLYNTPKFFELHTVVPGDILEHKNGTEYNATMYDLGISPFRLNFYYYNIYAMWMNFFLMGLIPFVILIVLNALTLKVSLHPKWKKNSMYILLKKINATVQYFRTKIDSSHKIFCICFGFGWCWRQTIVTCIFKMFHYIFQNL